MFAIVVNEKGGEQKRLEFDKPEVTIGRVQGNDIILPKGNVSKRHSRIVLKDGKFIIVDLKSTNGTYVNGRKITSPLVVKGSDKIYIGDFILSIEELQGAGVSDADNVPPPPPRAKQPTIPPPPPRRAPTGDYASDGEESDSGPADEPREETPPPPEPMRTARPTAPPNPSNPSMPAMSPSAPAPALARPAPVIAAAPAPARQPSPSRVDLPKPAPAPAARPASSPAPLSAARPAPAPVARAVHQPATQKRPAVHVDDSKRSKVTEVMRELSTRLAAALGVDSGNVDTTREEDLWTRAESAASDLLEQLSSDGAVPPGTDTAALLKDVVAETVGNGPFDELLGDEAVREIAVPRFDRVFVDRGDGAQLHAKWFSSPESLTRVVERMMARAGRQSDLHAARGAGGLVEARVEGGVLLAAALPPLAARGPALTIRRPRKGTAKLSDLTGDGVLSQGMADFLELALKQRRNILVSGPSGSGRTTLLGALGRTVIDWGERVATVEEAEELDLGEGAHVALVGRGAQARLALQAAMRMRPDRVIVGDLRGAEALDLLAAMSSGAEGCVCSVQAGSARDALARLAHLAHLAGEAPSVDTLRQELARGVQVIVQLGRSAEGEPRVTEISEVDGERVQAVFTYKPDAAGGRFAPTGHVPAWADGAPPSTFRA
jgi:pilus assembly protein CpaF